jgi:hypothetical protein
MRERLALIVVIVLTLLFLKNIAVNAFTYGSVTSPAHDAVLQF